MSILFVNMSSNTNAKKDTEVRLLVVCDEKVIIQVFSTRLYR